MDERRLVAAGEGPQVMFVTDGPGLLEQRAVPVMIVDGRIFRLANDDGFDRSFEIGSAGEVVMTVTG